MQLANLKVLQEHKKSPVAVFLGSGASINNITGEEWALIQECDMWTVNNWVYHPSIVPDFYHIEAKHYNYNILQRRMVEKQWQYGSTKFIFPKGKTIKVGKVRLPLHEIVPAGSWKFEYDLKARDRDRTHRPFTSDYLMNERILTKSYDMSVTLIFELLFKFGYEKIITFGIDLQNSFYFWMEPDPKYGEVHHRTNKEHEGRDPNSPHSTARIKEFIEDFHHRWMKPNGRAILVGHKDTLLFPGLDYVAMKDV